VIGLASFAYSALERISARALSRCHWIYLAIATPLIFFLVTVQPPFAAPDEGSHFSRAFMLSRGEVLPKVALNGFTGGHVDTALVPIFFKVAEKHRVPFGAVLQAEYGIPRWSGTIVLIGLNAAPYFPLAYVPQTFAVAVARVANIGIRDTVMLSALLNGLFCIGLSAFAIRVAQYGKPLLFCVAALPMTLALFSSSSADGAIISSALLMAAYLTRDAGFPAPDGSARASDLSWAVIGLCMACLAATKITYLPLLAIPIMICALSVRGRPALFLLVSVAVVAAWSMVVASTGKFFVTPGADSKAQISFLLAHPDAIPGLVLATLRHHGIGYLETMVGKLGWLDIGHPRSFYGLVVAAFVFALASCIGEQAQPRPVIRIVTLFGIVTSIGLVFMSLYVIWTVVGQNTIDGVQGRYFLPVLPFLPLAIAGLWPGASLSRALAIPALTLIPLATWLYTFKAVTMFYAAS
jgi:hypothetical protein